MGGPWLKPASDTGSDPRAVSRALAERVRRVRSGVDPMPRGALLTEWPERAAEDARVRAGSLGFALGFLVSSALWGVTLVLGAFVR